MSSNDKQCTSGKSLFVMSDQCDKSLTVMSSNDKQCTSGKLLFVMSDHCDKRLNGDVI